jgi:hypothetical protein
MGKNVVRSKIAINGPFLEQAVNFRDFEIGYVNYTCNCHGDIELKTVNAAGSMSCSYLNNEE